MNKIKQCFIELADWFWSKVGFGMRSKLITIFVLVKVIPILLIAILAWHQIIVLGDVLKEIAVNDSSTALNESATENIERMTTDTAKMVADFLYGRDADIQYIADITPSEENYRQFVEANLGRLIKKNQWELASDGRSWIPVETLDTAVNGGISTNQENDDMDGFKYRQPETYEYENIPLYDEITFVDLNGIEQIKVIASSSPKLNYPMDPEKKDVSKRENTYVKAETYFAELQELEPGEIYVSDVTGAYVGSNYIGMYTPEIVSEVAKERGYDIEYDNEEQAYAGMENPNGQRFEGIVRWATPVTNNSGDIIGYVTLALNHDHIMEYVDHITPMNERYTELPSAFEGNYAFIWDYQCRSICHPRHHSIVGFDPETGDQQIPWLESSIYDTWQASDIEKWTDFIEDWPTFDEQSREKKPAPALTQQGFVGLDGRYLNNAPQCTGWMDLTKDGGSGSFYILWSGLYKLTTAAAIPYYTGHYAPSELNDYSLRGFGIVTIGAGLEDFTRPATETEVKLGAAIEKNLQDTSMKLIVSTILLIILVVLIAIWIAFTLTRSITTLIKGVSRFRAGERQFRFNSTQRDEFGTLSDSFDDMSDSIVDSVKNPLCITDMNRIVIYMNDYGLELCKISLSEIVGTSYGKSSIYPEDSIYCPITALEKGIEAEVYYVDDMECYIKGVANYFLSKEGEKIGYIIETIDVTDMILEQIALEQAVSDANRANEHKGDFLARMSHEIRTPMNAIIGITNIVLKKLDDANSDDAEKAEIKGHVNQIEVSSQHLLGLLNDILDISKIEAGKIVLSEEIVELPKLVNTVAGIIKPRCDEKNITFKTVFDTFDPSAFLSDSLRLRQVLINLLGNAVKFTPECGVIEFCMAKRDQRDGETLVEFMIRDTGIGIHQDAVDMLFQPFEQGDNKISRNSGGTGLGLAISSNIVRLFGGYINVNSTLGEGSEFSFSIWLRETESDLPKDVILSDITGRLTNKRALLVDDVEINRMIVMSMLEGTGMWIDEADDGLVAVQKFEESAENTYDIVFMDVKMPNMDGYEASMAIRTLDRLDAHHVPIIALTANAFKDDIEKALDHGMNAHVAKPVEMDALLEVLFRFLISNE